MDYDEVIREQHYFSVAEPNLYDESIDSGKLLQISLQEDTIPGFLYCGGYDFSPEENALSSRNLSISPPISQMDDDHEPVVLYSIYDPLTRTYIHPEELPHDTPLCHPL